MRPIQTGAGLGNLYMPIVEYAADPSDEETYLAYIQMKLRARDWHAVADAANDLRELEAQTRATQKGLTFPYIFPLDEIRARR